MRGRKGEVLHIGSEAQPDDVIKRTPGKHYKRRGNSDRNTSHPAIFILMKTILAIRQNIAIM